MKDHRRQQKADALGSAVYSTCEASCLSREMKVKIQTQEMFEHVASYPANGFLGDVRENGIS